MQLPSFQEAKVRKENVQTAQVLRVLLFLGLGFTFTGLHTVRCYDVDPSNTHYLRAKIMYRLCYSYYEIYSLLHGWKMFT